MKTRMWAALALVFSVAAFAQGQNNGAAVSAKASEQVARDALAKQLKIDAANIEAVSAEPQTWPNSGLGCAKGNAATLQVLTSGYAFVLKTPRGNYRVHATDKRAVVCGAAGELRNPRNVAAPVKHLNERIEEARNDLAHKLGAPPNQIRVANLSEHTWPDTAMECPAQGEKADRRTVNGYRIALNYRGRVYTYHTDLEHVRACPPIEVK